jgi:cell migration-inducing and hyaluronan-binding protein
MHGVSRINWAYLDGTSNVGATTITMAKAVDWKAGEYIVVASTDFEGRHAEKRLISSVNNTNAAKPVVTLSTALTYKHYSNDQNGLITRCEVILLTRNIVFRGDTATSASNLFGAHLMLLSQGDEASIGRIENVEFTDVGQANQ